MGDYDLRPSDDAGNRSIALSELEKRMYYTLFSCFLAFILWYGLYTSSWLGGAWSIFFCFVVGSEMAWAVRTMKKEKLEELLNEIRD
jgi:hypothetical protein